MTRHDKNPWPRAVVGRGEVYALLGALAYALNNVLSGMATRNYPLNHFLGAASRAMPMLLVTLVLGFGPKRNRSKSWSAIGDWRTVASLLVIGLLVYVVGGPLLFAALREGGVLVATPVVGTQVLWSAVIAALWLRQPLNRRMALGMVIGVLGVSLLTLGRTGSVQFGPRWWLALPYSLGAALSWASSAVLSARAMERGIDRYRLLAISASAGVLGLNAVLWARGELGVWVETPPAVLLQVLIAGVMGMAGLMSFTAALGLTTVASANALNSLQVGLAPLIAWLVMGEAMNVPMAAGILFILIGVITVQVSRPVAAPVPADSAKATHV